MMNVNIKDIEDMITEIQKTVVYLDQTEYIVSGMKKRVQDWDDEVGQSFNEYLTEFAAKAAEPHEKLNALLPVLRKLHGILEEYIKRGL